MTAYAVIVRGAAVQPGTPAPGAVAPHPGAVEDTGPRACSGTTKAGEPCKGRAGDDGFCAAHKDQAEDAEGE